ncbi:MAG: hypothetical protein OXL97_11760 [Chloroflexota bacterium]|nr:hypothetical protein [Chloroflexota bacterium]MDE2884646.1 hypothetical protein [Chloroflexota bacterium]
MIRFAPVLLALLLVACSSPTPTATPVRASTAAPVAGWNLTNDSTGATITDLVSGDERACLEDALGSSYIPFQKKKLFSLSPLLPDWLAMDQHNRFMNTLDDCLTVESQAAVWSWELSVDAGGLGAETRHCIAGVFLDSTQPARRYDVMECLTQEQAVALGDGKAHDWCVNRELRKVDWGREALQELRSGDRATLDALDDAHIERVFLIGVACAGEVLEWVSGEALG